MQKRRVIIVSALIVAGIASIAAFWVTGYPKNTSAAMTPFSSNFSDLRIENEAKLVVPADQLEQVWAYLLKRLVTDKTYIHSLDPAFDSYWYDELFTDVYFDTPDLVMLDHRSSIRHRSRVNLTDPEQEKSGRELVQIKLNDINQNDQSRGELKFDVSLDLKPNEADDLHPVLGLLKKADRPEFKDVMAKLKVDPYQLRKILILKQRRRSIYITRNGEAFMSIRLDEVTSSMLWANYINYEIEPELNEIPYTAANEKERAYMEGVKVQIMKDIERQFPDIQLNLTPKYNKAFNFFEANIPRLRLLIQSGLIQ